LAAPRRLVKVAGIVISKISPAYRREKPPTREGAEYRSLTISVNFASERTRYNGTMLKLASIVVLLGTISLTAMLTRPAEAQFRDVMLDRIAKRGESQFYQNFMRSRLENEMKTYTFRNHLLWVDVERKGEVAYSGLLGHWIERNIQKRF
jgi:hypothetical protein